MSFEPGAAGSGNTPPVSPPQGNNGGTATSDTAPYKGAGGGGGAGRITGGAFACLEPGRSNGFIFSE